MTVSNLQALVIQKVDNAIHWINLNPVDNAVGVLIHWIVIYRVYCALLKTESLDNAILGFDWLSRYGI